MKEFLAALAFSVGVVIYGAAAIQLAYDNGRRDLGAEVSTVCAP